jgi:hypothetical protein
MSLKNVVDVTTKLTRKDTRDAGMLLSWVITSEAWFVLMSRLISEKAHLRFIFK